MLDKIKEIILEAIPNAQVHVLDPRNDGHHLEAIVISESFSNQSLINQHKAVMNPLKAEFQSTVHALGLKTFTPDAWNKLENKPV